MLVRHVLSQLSYAPDELLSLFGGRGFKSLPRRQKGRDFITALFYAQVAQLVEQRTENPRVAGSIPALGTTL